MEKNSVGPLAQKVSDYTVLHALVRQSLASRVPYIIQIAISLILAGIFVGLHIQALSGNELFIIKIIIYYKNRAHVVHIGLF